MAETSLNVRLIAYTQLAPDFAEELAEENELLSRVPDTQIVATTAIRTCYSPNKPTEIVKLEGEKYFGRPATDGEGGTEADRLIRHIMRSKHLSTQEHLNYTFAVEGLSRAALAQLTRHRFFSFSVQSQRYVRFGSKDKSGGFDYVIPPTIQGNPETLEAFQQFMDSIQQTYDRLRELGIPGEDARSVLSQASATNLVMTGNLRAILEFYAKRKPGRGAQHEIAALAEAIRREVTKVDSWTGKFFEEV